MRTWFSAFRRGIDYTQRGWTEQQRRDARVLRRGMVIILVSAVVVMVVSPWSERVTVVVAALGAGLLSGLFVGAFAVLRNRR